MEAHVHAENPLLGAEFGQGDEEAVVRQPRRRREQHLAEKDAWMVAEVAADLVVRIADAALHLAVEIEQEPRVLDAAGAEREEGGLDGEARVVRRVGPEHCLGNPVEARIEPEVDEVGVEPEPDPVGGGDLVEIFLAEPGRRAVAPLGLLEAADRVGQVDDLRHGPGQVEDVGRLRRIGVEVGLADRPAVAGAVQRVRQEARGIEIGAGSVPVPGGAAEVPEPRHVEVVVGQPGDLADVDAL